MKQENPTKNKNSRGLIYKTEQIKKKIFCICYKISFLLIYKKIINNL